MNKLVIFILIALFILLSFRVYKKSDSNDFLSTYNAAKRVSSNSELYIQEEGMHGLMWSPFYAVAASPLSIFNLKQASIIFFIASYLALIFSCLLLAKVFIFKDLKWTFLPLLLSLRFAVDNFGYGQINSFMILCVALGIYFGSYNKNFFFSSFFIMLAASIKVFPLVFLVLFLPELFKNKILIKKYFFGIIAAGLLIFALPALVLGLKNSISEFNNWQLMMSTAFSRMPLNHHGNQSLTGLIIRSFGDNYSAIGIYTSLFICLLLCLFSLKQSLLKRICIITIASIIFSPIVWKHTLLFLLIPSFYIVWLIKNNGIKSLLNYPKYILLIFLFLSVFSSSSFVGANLNLVLMNYGILLFTLLTLGLFFILDKKNA